MTDKEGNAQKEGQNFISWITLILGILALSLGFSLLFIPDKTHKMLNNFMAIFWQMTGIVMIRQETHLIRNRLLLILGISGVLIGSWVHAISAGGMTVAGCWVAPKNFAGWP